MMKCVPLLAALSVLVLGCGVTERSVVGEYQGTLAEGEPDRGGIERDIAGSVRLDVREDKTFRLTAAVVPIEGTWSLQDGRLVCTPTALLGMSRNLSFKVDGGTLEPVEDIGGKRFRFVKVHKPDY